MTWLGPGFFDDGQWRSFEPDPIGPDRLWVAPYDAAPFLFRGRLQVSEPTFTSGPVSVALDETGFETGVQRIREQIAAGDVYQVNLTARAQVTATGPALFAALGQARFSAWVQLPGLPSFISASPELLFERVGRLIRAEPMKGTAAPNGRLELERSEKDRAELAMITDLTRNDLQQLCVPQSVQVRSARRFIELPYVVQAVSDVEGLLHEGVTTERVLEVMHPGGSVTGAPRKAAMALIRQLEPTSRRLYCGTLAVESNDRCCASLLIRTATSVGADTWAYGVGSGITWGSRPDAELAEVRLKLGALGR